MNDEKTQVNDIDRSLYDFRYEEKEGEFFRLEQGLTKEIVEKLSAEKGDPEWMKEFRLKSLEIYNQLRVPDWGPSIDDLHMDQIATYVRPNTKMQGKWEDVPQDIKDTFEKLGIPEAERKSLAGVGAQFDSAGFRNQTQLSGSINGIACLDGMYIWAYCCRCFCCVNCFHNIFLPFVTTKLFPILTRYLVKVN